MQYGGLALAITPCPSPRAVAEQVASSPATSTRTAMRRIAFAKSNLVPCGLPLHSTLPWVGVVARRAKASPQVMQNVPGRTQHFCPETGAPTPG
jgi:hypothetical protein